MTQLKRIIDSILNPGEAIGRGLALNGIDESMAQVYVIGLLDKDELAEMLQNLDPETAAKVSQIADIAETVSLAMGVANLGQAISSFGPQTVLFELIDAIDAAGDVHTSHQAIITIMDEANVPGFDRVEFEVNGTPVTLYIDASGQTNNHGAAYSGHTEKYAEYSSNGLSTSEISAINQQIQAHVARVEAEAASTSSYGVSMDMMKEMNPELHAQIEELDRQGLGGGLPVHEGGPTRDSPAAVANLNMISGGLY